MGSGSSTETLAIRRNSGASGAQAAQQAQQQGPAKGAEQDTVIVTTRGRPAGSQHSGSLADHYNNRTSHTFTSTSSGATLGSMDGSTVPLRTTPHTGGDPPAHYLSLHL